MKILEINATFNIGSTGHIVHDLGHIFNDLGHEVYYAYQYAANTPKNGIIIGNKFDWKLHALLCRILGGQGFYSYLSTYLFIRKIKKIRPDIIHLHNLHSNFINIKILLSFLAKHNIPTVITLHDCWFFTGKCFHYVDINCDKYKKSCGKCPKLLAPPKSIFVDRTSKDLNLKKELLYNIPRLAIVGCSNWIVEQAKTGFMKEMNISSIYNGVDTTIFKKRHTELRHDLEIKHSDFVILGMANKWTQQRNIGIISQILSRINNICIVIIGCTDENKKKLHTISKDIRTIGFITDRYLLSEYYNMADVFVNLTHADTLPTVNMESICCGTPVITYDVGGSSELVVPGTGYIVKEDDIEGIIKALLDLKNTPLPKCSDIGISIYNKDTCYKRYLEIFSKINK